MWMSIFEANGGDTALERATDGGFGSYPQIIDELLKRDEAEVNYPNKRRQLSLAMGM
jgi:hypothetical protein